jgi:hypothetical protein
MLRKLSLNPGVVIEPVGQELLVVVPGNQDVLRLSGAPAEALLDIQAGRTLDSHNPVVSDLVELGFVSTPDVSRRGLIKAGAIGAGAGIAVLAMPSVAAAASVAPVTVFGFYGLSQSGGVRSTYIDVWLFDFPNLFLEKGDVGAIAPSAMTVDRGVGQAEVTYWVANDVNGKDGDYVSWRVQGLEPDGLTGTYLGTFTWDGVPYEAQLVPSDEFVWS